jgi:SAM-dependent methyltransferase
MKKSIQDEYYLSTESDNFFDRMIKNKNDNATLRAHKVSIFEAIKESKVNTDNVLEFGCNYGDMLYRLVNEGHSKKCFGIEPSEKAVKFGTKKYGKSISLNRGTIADNKINESGEYNNSFDLIIIDDVFGWVSRETILQSIANIDSLVKDGGSIFIRDFYPDKRVKNLNHHISEESIFNYKIPFSHASIFEATGMFEVHWQKTYFDNIGMSTGYKCDNNFNYRWTDVILKKSLTGYFNESKKL